MYNRAAALLQTRSGKALPMQKPMEATLGLPSERRNFSACTISLTAFGQSKFSIIYNQKISHHVILHDSTMQILSNSLLQIELHLVPL